MTPPTAQLCSARDASDGLDAFAAEVAKVAHAFSPGYIERGGGHNNDEMQRGTGGSSSSSGGGGSDVIAGNMLATGGGAGGVAWTLASTAAPGVRARTRDVVPQPLRETLSMLRMHARKHRVMLELQSRPAALAHEIILAFQLFTGATRLAGIVPKLRELHSHYSEAAAFIDGMRTTFGLGPLASTKELRTVLDACGWFCLMSSACFFLSSFLSFPWP